MIRLLLLFIVLILITGCRSDNSNLIKINGKAQGTTWHIAYLSKEENNHKPAIDSLLKDIDNSLSTYVPSSIISRINKNDKEVIPDNYFIDVFNKSRQVSERTGGLFDVTVAPIVNAWGFGFTKKARVDSAIIDSLLNFVDYRMVRLEGKKLIKAKPEIMLDFNSIAQGYTVDVIAAYLDSQNINNYLVELGGEVRAKGKKNNENWKVGIDQADENPTSKRKLEGIIALNNKALATSGNYRKFYEEKGQKYAHILNPQTGYPARQNLLSATVLAPDAITADAYATAFMVMGLERSRQFVEDNKDLKLEVYFIFDQNGSSKTYSSASLKKWIKAVH